MDIQSIKDQWRLRPGDVEAEVAAWDSVASDYSRGTQHNFEDDPFLHLLAEKEIPGRGMKVLDVGCGAGAYAEAVAERAGTVDGVDFSPEMIRLAQHNAEQAGISNIRYLKRDWHTCDASEFRDRYDLAFAHTTPAVMDYTTFMKLYEASSRYGLYCRPTRRTDSVFDEVYRIAGISRRKDIAIPCAFDLLWELGERPEVYYTDVIWHPRRTMKEAAVWYLERLRGVADIDRSTEKRILDFLKQSAVDGIIEEEIRSTLVTLFWEKTRSE